MSDKRLAEYDDALQNIENDRVWFVIDLNNRLAEIESSLETGESKVLMQWVKSIIKELESEYNA